MDNKNVVSFPIVRCGRYTKESLAKAVAEYNERPADERWGEDRTGGWGDDYQIQRFPEPERQLLTNVCITLESDGYWVTGEPTGPIPVQLLARPYGIDFAIRGEAIVGHKESELVHIVSIDLVKHKELYHPQEAVGKVLLWANERGILANGKVTTQITKYYEEIGEIATGICKNKRDLVIDGIGDAIVVLTNIMGIAKRDVRPHLLRAEAEFDLADDYVLSNDPHELYSIHQEHVTQAMQKFRIHRGSLAERLAKEDLHYALIALHDLAACYNTDLSECVSDAWDEIKDRKGFLNAEGVFIKEADA